MTRRISSRTLPSAPLDWEPATRDIWNQLIKVIEQSDLFDLGRRNRPLFVVQGTVSAPVTLDMTNPSVTALTHVVGKLLLALQPSNFATVKEL